MAIGEGYTKVKTLDMHTGGEPLRIVLEGYPSFEGLGILAIRKQLQHKYDHLRKVLMWEPRGHADMYGLLKVPAQRNDSSFGVIFMHNAGYSTMCGHATIAIGKAAIKMEWIPPTPPLTEFKIDAPCGQIKVVVHHKADGKVDKVSFENVPSFYVGRYQLDLPTYGSITYDLAYGGAFYTYVDIHQFGIKCQPQFYSQIIHIGKQIKHSVQEHNPDVLHPFEDDLSFLYGTIFVEGSQEPGIHSRNVCVFAEGEVDRSPTGSGISGRAAIHNHYGELPENKSIAIKSILGTKMEVSIKEIVNYGPYQAVVPTVTGNAFFTGQHEFWIDPEDPLKEGFFLQ